MQAEAPPLLSCVAPQLKQSVSREDPLPALYLPAAQGVFVSEPPGQLRKAGMKSGSVLLKHLIGAWDLERACLRTSSRFIIENDSQGWVQNVKESDRFSSDLP